MAPLTPVAGHHWQWQWQSALVDVAAHQLEQSALVDHQVVDQAPVADHVPLVVDQAQAQHAGAMVECHCDAPAVVV